jgi:cytochrome bd-type quinol oxidase subunit 1
METIGAGHWIFAGVFALAFVVGLVYAYREDIRKTPDLFNGSSKFLLSVILIIMILVVIKMISRLGS